MGLLAKLKEWLAQLGAETGVAEPYHPPRLSDDLLAEPTAELPRRGEMPAADAVDIHRTDIPPELPHQLPPRTPLAPDLPEPTDRWH